jgi:glutathione peroxidase
MIRGGPRTGTVRRRSPPASAHPASAHPASANPTQPASAQPAGSPAMPRTQASATLYAATLSGTALLLAACSGFFAERTEVDPAAAQGSLYELTAESLAGEPVDLGRYAGQVSLVVNTASECGLTPQLAGLQDLQEEFGPRGLVVLGFPSNEFGGQEPGTAAEIQTFCSENYGVTFPLFAKVRTKAGEGQSPVYAYLGGATGTLPGWNFGKYLVSRDGRVLGFFDSRVSPADGQLRGAIEQALGGS